MKIIKLNKRNNWKMNLSVPTLLAMTFAWPTVAAASSSSSSSFGVRRIRVSPSSLASGVIVSTVIRPNTLFHLGHDGQEPLHWHWHGYDLHCAVTSRTVLAAALRHRGGHADYIGDDDNDNDDTVPPWENVVNDAENVADIVNHDQQQQQQHHKYQQQQQSQYPPHPPWTNHNFQQNQQQNMQHQRSSSAWGGTNNNIMGDTNEPSLPGGGTASATPFETQYPSQQHQHGMGGRGKLSSPPSSSLSSSSSLLLHQQQQQRQDTLPYPFSQQMSQQRDQAQQCQQQQNLQQQLPSHHQQHQNHIHTQYPPPPNLPGYNVGGQRNDRRPYHQQQQQQQVQQATTIHNAHHHRHVNVPGGMPNIDIDEDDEYFIDNNDNINDDSDKEGEEEDVGGGDNISLSPSEVESSSSSMDLSQFDKDVIFSGLKRLYRKKIRPLELSSKYGHFHSPPLSPSDFDSKPMVLLLGQYSVGKTSFIRYLLGRDFPGQRIGPEPTTDRFVAIVKGEVGGDKIIPGAALCSQADRPFRGLSSFGNNFLNRFEGVEMDSPILNNITLVDTPGILSGQKQSIGRNYDYEQVMKWFAERADLIIIMFDAHKLDISDELKRVIELLKPHQDKVRVLLNKADSVSTQQLMRVYGALMWSLGKVMLTPEVCRVYMGSFWGAPLKNREQAALLMRERQDLFDDIARLPQNAVMRRINELVKRARSVKVHAYIMHYLRKQLPYTWGKREKQRRLIDRLDREFVMCARRYELPRGDFPELEPFRQALLEIKDLSEIHKLDKKMVKEMDKVFSVDIPNLLLQAKFHG